MSVVSQSETFWLTWKLENIHLSNKKIHNYISTPVFQVGLLQNTMWQLMFAPAGFDDALYMGLSLGRMSSERKDEPEAIKFMWKINVIAEGGIVRFEKRFNSILKHNEFVHVWRFIRKSDLLSTDMPQNSLTIYCEMTNDSVFSSELELKYDLEALSSDLTSLLESGFRSDFVMYCRGAIFNVHKFIILSRWPRFCQRFQIDNISTKHDIIITGIESSTLKTFLTFLYSGKLQRKDISMELCTYMYEQQSAILMESLETPVSNIEFVTHMHHEKKCLTWEVGDDHTWKTSTTPFFRVISLEDLYPREMVITFSFEKRNGEEWLKLGAEFTGFNVLQPLLLDGEISFTNKGSVVYSRKFNHLVETRDEWYFPQLVRKNDLLPSGTRNSKCIEIYLCICDGNLQTRQVSANIKNASRFLEIRHLRKLIMDLIESSYEKDLKLKIGDCSYDVHSTLIASRSEKFRKLIENNVGIIEVEEYMSRKASDSLIQHLYGESLLVLDVADLISLNRMAKRYSLASLEEKTRRILQERQICCGNITIHRGFFSNNFTKKEDAKKTVGILERCINKWLCGL